MYIVGGLRSGLTLGPLSTQGNNPNLPNSIEEKSRWVKLAEEKKHASLIRVSSEMSVNASNGCCGSFTEDNLREWISSW